MLIFRVPIYIFGISYHHRIMPCTWFPRVRTYLTCARLKRPVACLPRSLVSRGYCRSFRISPEAAAAALVFLISISIRLSLLRSFFPLLSAFVAAGLLHSLASVSRSMRTQKNHLHGTKCRDPFLNISPKSCRNTEMWKKVGKSC